MPSLDMYNAVYPSHYIHIQSQNGQHEGRRGEPGSGCPSNTTPTTGGSKPCHMTVPRRQDRHSQPSEQQRRETAGPPQQRPAAPSSSSAGPLTLPRQQTPGGSTLAGGERSPRASYNKKEFWNSRQSQGRNKRLGHGNSAPCLITVVTDESTDSGLSRSPTPNRHPTSSNYSALSQPSTPAHYRDKDGSKVVRRSSPSRGGAPSRGTGGAPPRSSGPPPSAPLSSCQRRESNSLPKRRGSYNSHSNYHNNNNNSNHQRNQNGGFYRYNRQQQHTHHQQTPNDLVLQSYAHFYHGPLIAAPLYTPPDRFLQRAHCMQVTEAPKDLVHGTVWDQLSQSTWQKFYVNQQSQCTFEKKLLLWKHLFLFFKQFYPRYGLYLVGSTMNGFGSNYSDVDLCLLVSFTEVDQRSEALQYLSEILGCLGLCDFVEKPELILAKVPLLKFRDVREGFQIDLNCNNSVGIRNTHLLYCYGQLDWRVKPLVVVVKLWAQCHNINDAKCMTISSYSIALMVIHFLQCGVTPEVLPCLHSLYPEKFNDCIGIVGIDMHEKLEPYISENKQPLGQLLLQFFQYYATFDFQNDAISVRLGSTVPVEECRQARSRKNDAHQWKLLCIEEPFDLTNTARSVYDPVKFEHIRSIIRRTAQALMKTKKLDSIFTLDGS